MWHERPQEQHADLGLIDDDRTPDMRKPSAHPAKNDTEGNRTSHHERD